MEGIYLIDKPEGMTSFDVIRQLRKQLKTKEIGHAGTLDPMATGLLVILVGKATKLSNVMLNKTKTYEAEITFGFATDSYDKMGKIIDTKTDFFLNQAMIEEGLNHLRSKTSQLPPIYSAIKVDGKKLYEYARNDLAVDIKEKDIVIHELKTTMPLENNSFKCEMTVSKGTYVRSIAHDLGTYLGVPSHLSQLRRTQSGDYHIRDAQSLENLITPFITVEDYAKTIEQVVVDDYLIPLIKNGIRLDQRQTTIEGPFTAISKTGKLLAIYQRDDNNYKPIIQLGV